MNITNESPEKIIVVAIIIFSVIIFYRGRPYKRNILELMYDISVLEKSTPKEAKEYQSFTEKLDRERKKEREKRLSFKIRKFFCTNHHKIH